MQSVASGWVAMTTDQLPQIGRLVGGAWAGYGCCGGSLAGATRMGREPSRLAAEDAAHQPYVPVRDVRPLPFHRFGKNVVATRVNWYRLADKRALCSLKHQEQEK
jgi:glycine/D-amino acid oxidase-like deaminating enzyme